MPEMSEVSSDRRRFKILGRKNDAQAEYEPFFNTMTLVLDRRFVHRLCIVTGKDGNALNEVEMICDSLMNNEVIHPANNVIRYMHEQAVP